MAVADRKHYFLKNAPILLAICLAYVLNGAQFAG